jgi:hypothetical protein
MSDPVNKGGAVRAQGNWDKPFLRGIFCEEDGSPSFSRLATGFMLAFELGWVTDIVIRTHALPDFAGLALFIGTLYGTNRLAGMFSKPAAPAA